MRVQAESGAHHHHPLPTNIMFLAFVLYTSLIFASLLIATELNRSRAYSSRLFCLFQHEDLRAVLTEASTSPRAEPLTREPRFFQFSNNFLGSKVTLTGCIAKELIECTGWNVPVGSW